MTQPKILIVEDNEDLLHLLVRQFVRDGYEVFSAVEARAGFKQALKHKPDVVISDIVLGDIDGLTMVRELRNHEDFQTTPVIILTAYNDLKYLGRAVACAVDEYILKNRTNPAEVSRTVGDLLQKAMVAKKS